MLEIFIDNLYLKLTMDFGYLDLVCLVLLFVNQLLEILYNNKCKKQFCCSIKQKYFCIKPKELRVQIKKSQIRRFRKPKKPNLF